MVFITEQIRPYQAATDGVDETIKELKKIPGFSSYLILNNDGKHLVTFALL